MTEEDHQDNVQEEEEERPEVTGHSNIHPDDQYAKTTVFNFEGIYKAAATFEDLKLSEPLLRGIADMKFEYPSKIQAEALPLLLSEERPHFIGQAHHGSGKTATFVLAMLSQVNPKLQKPQGLVLCPSRELAVQTHRVVCSLGKYLAAKPAWLALSDQPAWDGEPTIVGTPGYLKALIGRKQLDIGNVLTLVVDEADFMIAKPFEGLSQHTFLIRRMMPRNAQVLLFSATFPKEVQQFADEMAPNCIRILVEREKLSLEKVKQFYLQCSWEDRINRLKDLYSVATAGQSIVFVRSIGTARFVANSMRKDGFQVAALHSQLDWAERDRVMDDFRRGKVPVLISTNVLARGIDVLQVRMVFNFDLPAKKERGTFVLDPETFIHRVGRSGRFGRRGIAVNFVHDKETAGWLQQLQEYFNLRIVEFPKDFQKACTMIEGFIKGDSGKP